MRVDAKAVHRRPRPPGDEAGHRPAGDGRHGLLGYGAPGNDNPIPPSWPAAYTHEAPKRDVAKAKELLAEAGYPNGIDIDLNTAEGSPGMVKMAEAYQQMAAEAGIRVNLIQNPANSYWDTVWNKRALLHHRLVGAHAGAGPLVHFPRSRRRSTSRTGTGMTTTRCSSRRPASSTKRNAPRLYNEAQKMLTEEGGDDHPVLHQDGRGDAVDLQRL